MIIDRSHPLAHILKGLLIGDIKGDDNSVCLFVESVCKGLKSLLSCCVPDFDYEFLIGFGWRETLLDVVKTEGGHMRLYELTLSVHFEERSLTDCTVT